ncbi:MAG: hypothetical protein HUU55_21010, partial [Myxococcales bacterium]|nr:hypothetical protein [Myxococcales bacterium]
MRQTLTHTVASLIAGGEVELMRVAQDGIRVRASAGAASFRRRRTVETALREAGEQVQKLRKEVESDPSGSERRRRAAEQRAAEDRLRRLSDAMEHMKEIEQQRALRDCKGSEASSGQDTPCPDPHGGGGDTQPSSSSSKKSDEEPEKPRSTCKVCKRKPKKEKTIPDPRVSTTDPEARIMKMPNGGSAPAFNVQLATDTATQVIVGVDVILRGNDFGEMSPMQEQLQARYGKSSGEWLMDGGYVTGGEIQKATKAGTTVYAPLKTRKNSKRNPYEPRAGDSSEVAAWRERMGTEAAKAISKRVFGKKITASETVAVARRACRPRPTRGVPEGTLRMGRPRQDRRSRPMARVAYFFPKHP